MKHAARIALQLAVVALALYLWQLLSSSGRINANTYGEPSAILSVWQNWWGNGELVSSTLATLEVVVLGMLLGTAFGCLAGTLIGLSALIRDVVEPFVMFYNGIPRMILLPLLVVPLGFGTASAITLVILVAWVIVTLNVAAGCREMPKDVLAHVRILGGGALGVARDVWVPSVALWVVASSRTTFQFAFAAAVFAEFSGSPEGLGHLVVVGQQTFQVNQVLAALLIVAVLGAAGNVLLDQAEQAIGRWRLT